MVVRTYWPGATAQQVAEQVTDKIERTLQEVPYADKIRSYSKPGESQIIFQIKDSSKAAEVANVWYTVRKKIGDMRSTLPAGVQGPFFNDDFGDVYGVIYALESDGFSYAELKTLRRRRAPATAAREGRGQGRPVRRAGREGLHRDLAEAPGAAGAGLQPVLAQLGSQNAIESAGTMQTPLDVVQVRVAGQFTSVDQLREMPIRGSSGNQLRLGDIAEIKRGYVDPPAVKVHHQGKEVIALGVSMAKGGDIIALGKALKDATKPHRPAAAGRREAGAGAGPAGVGGQLGQRVRRRADRGRGHRAGRELHRARPAQAAGASGWYIDMRPGLVVASPFRWCWP
jgi:multidrug efflux pump